MRFSFRSRPWAALGVAGALVLQACGPAAEADERLVGANAICLGSTSPADLTALFDAEPGGIVGADYQRAIALPDGRTLWMFQDAYLRVSPPPPPGQPEMRLVHNAALVQTGTCFERLGGGTPAEPTIWLQPGPMTPFSRWYWPLDATVVADGTVWVFMAEMVELGPHYLSRTEPVATRVVALDKTTLQPIGSGFPHNSSADLYGWSIAEDDDWTYLFAHCYRQFGFDPIIFRTLAHDFSCSANVTVGRVSKGQVLEPPDYWDGASWQPDPARAAPVISTARRLINPTQVEWTGEEFLAVTKEGDWLGTTIYLDRAPAPQGPWTTYARLPARPKCEPSVCNTYFASWVPPVSSTSTSTVGLSHNRWDGQLSTVYRPTFFSVPPPGDFPFAARCALVHC